MGMEMFDSPRPVLGISDDGGFAFVPGTDTGLPIEELSIVGRAVIDTDKKTAPVNPFVGAGIVPPKTQNEPIQPTVGFKEDAYDLAEGRAVLRWPEKLTKESVGELKDWFDLIIRKMARMTGAQIRIGTIKDVASTTAPAVPISGQRAIILPEDDQ